MSLFGLGIEDYLKILTIFISLFFFWRWFFGKWIKSAKKRFYTALITACLLMPLIYIGIILVWYFHTTSFPHRKFNRDLWYSQIEYRYELSGNIIEGRILIGKTKDEVKEMLGDEKNQYENDIWTYYLGFVPAIAKIDPDILVVEFENGVVVRVRQRET